MVLITVSDWDVYERLLDHGFSKALGVDPKQHPILLAEPSFNTRQHCERATELLFEKYQVPAFFTAKNAVLALYVAITETQKPVPALTIITHVTLFFQICFGTQYRPCVRLWRSSHYSSPSP